LLEEKRYPRIQTNLSNLKRPLLFHWPSTWSGLAPHDDPVDTSQVQIGQRTEQFERQEADVCLYSQLERKEYWVVSNFRHNIDVVPRISEALQSSGLVEGRTNAEQSAITALSGDDPAELDNRTADHIVRFACLTNGRFPYG
jgi:hypothetical protein